MSNRTPSASQLLMFYQLLTVSAQPRHRSRVQCNAGQGYAKQRSYIFVYTWPSIKTDIWLSTVRIARHKLTLELSSGAGELYGLVNDPYEMDNRFAGSALAAVRRELSYIISNRPVHTIAPLLQVGMA
jgi:hypothetical protein